MRVFASILASCLCLFVHPLLSSAASDTAFPSSATIYYWPVSSPSPSPLTKINYNPADSSSKSLVQFYTPPVSTLHGPSLVRIGLYDPHTAKWRGIATGASIFAREEVLLTLHLDPETGEAYHVGISTYTAPPPSSYDTKTKPKPKTAEKAEETTRLRVNLAKSRPGAEPKLNKPVVLDAEGKIPEKEPEKTFFQKYWWLLLIVTMIALSGGGGDGK